MKALCCSVELCTCPPGFYGYSCEDCALGYYRSQEGPLGPHCKACECNGHADICHPLTGECVTMEPLIVPPGVDPDDPTLCHFRPDQCLIVDEEVRKRLKIDLRFLCLLLLCTLFEKLQFFTDSNLFEMA